MEQVDPAPARVAAALVEGAQCMQDFELVLLECLASELSQQRSLRGDASSVGAGGGFRRWDARARGRGARWWWVEGSLHVAVAEKPASVVVIQKLLQPSRQPAHVFAAAVAIELEDSRAEELMG